MKDQRLPQSGVAQYSSASQLLMHRLESDGDLLMSVTWLTQLDLWIGWLLALRNIADLMSHLLSFQAT